MAQLHRAEVARRVGQCDPHTGVAEAHDVGSPVRVHVRQLARVAVVARPAAGLRGIAEARMAQLHRPEVARRVGQCDPHPGVAEAHDVGSPVRVHVRQLARVAVVARPAAGLRGIAEARMAQLHRAETGQRRRRGVRCGGGVEVEGGVGGDAGEGVAGGVADHAGSHADVVAGAGGEVGGGVDGHGRAGEADLRGVGHRDGAPERAGRVVDLDGAGAGFDRLVECQGEVGADRHAGGVVSWARARQKRFGDVAKDHTEALKLHRNKIRNVVQLIRFIDISAVINLGCKIVCSRHKIDIVSNPIKINIRNAQADGIHRIHRASKDIPGS